MSFILDALRKLEEKRAPETTRELLAAGVPAPPRGTGRGKPRWPYIVSAVLAVSLLASAGWFALKERAGGGEGEPPPASSSVHAGEGLVRLPPAPSAAVLEAPEKAGTFPSLPERPLGDPPSPAPEIPPQEEPAAGKEVPEGTSPSGEVDSAPLPAEGGDGPLEDEVTASPVPVEQAAATESPAALPLLPFHELPEEIKSSLKDLRIEGHVYSDDPGFRLVSIDGSLRREGDTVRPGLLIETISPEGAVFAYRGHRFSMKGF